ncbi:MAG TPA: UDP-glucose 4-epimerase GalE [Nocardioidaceae bacterium]|nr:UDP-glucose 4-epimerase GalE [Nocardioidaceae bacterium]
MKVLVTGGAGYIGSTTAKALENAGHTPVVLDSLLTGPRQFVRDRAFYEGEVGDRDLIRGVVEEHPDLACTIHLAARIVVPESVAQPYLYYRDNVAQSLELFDELVRLGKPRVVFSSSASVYAAVEGFEVTEESPLQPPSPYARTKAMTEQAIEDLAATAGLRAVVLRYFNPIGSDPDLESGIYAREPSHVLGQMLLAALGRVEAFTVTGTEHPTRDGTGLRDYVHVWDVAQAHVASVERFDDALATAGAPSVVLNVGTGRGITVRELLAVFEAALGRTVPTREAPPRPGDSVGAYAAVGRARDLLGWSSQLTVTDGVDSALRWMRHRRDVLGYD